MPKEEEKEKKSEAFDNETLKKTRTVMLSGEIDKALADQVIRQLVTLDAEKCEPIWVYINSPGGDVDAGFAIYDMMRFVNSEVRVLGVGLVASAAALVYIAVPEERRFALPNSTYLIHQPLSGMRGVAADIEIHAAQLEKIKGKLNALIAEATGKDLESVVKDTDRDYWLTAEEAREYGLVGKIVKNKGELPE